MGNRYWFDTHPSIQRTASEYAERLKEQPEEVWLEIVNRLRSTESKDRGSFAGVHVAPDSPGDIPDEDSARLVIIHPSATYLRGNMESPALQFARAAFEKKGSGHRVNRNMVTFWRLTKKGLKT